MDNLTSFMLCNTSLENDTAKHLLDFFESAPCLREVRLHFVAPTSSAQSGQLVSLGCLKKMEIIGNKPCSLLLDHLLIPVGAELTIQVDYGRIEDHLPRSLDNFMNLSNFTKICLHVDKHSSGMRLSGLNRQLSMKFSRGDTYFNIDSLTVFDTSKTERWEVISAASNYYTSGNSFS